MILPTRVPDTAPAVCALLVLLLVAGGPALAQAPSASPAGPPAPDFMKFEEVRYSDKLESDGRIERVQQIKVLLRDGAAVAEFGQIASPYVDGYAEVWFEEVWIEKPDGRRIEVNNGLVEDLNPFGVTDSAMSADIRFKKLTLPGLEPGDTLSYRVVTRQRPIVPGRVFGEVTFVALPSDPTFVYELDLPRDAQVTVDLRKELGVPWEEVPGPPDRIKRRLSVRLRRPDFGAQGPSEAEAEELNQPDVTFTTFRSWTEVAEWWWGLAKDRLEPDAAVRTQAAALVQGKTSARDKIEALHAFVASRVRYLNVSFGLGRMQPRSASDVLAKKYGDCKDKVALLVALGSAVGIDVRPVLVSSKRRHLRDTAPGPQQFDHMIAVARLSADPKSWLWLDATNELGPVGYLVRPLRDQPALLVERTGAGQMVRTPATLPFPRRVEAAIKGTLAADGPLRIHVRWVLRNDTEPVLRDAFRRTPPDQRAGLLTHTLGPGWNEARITNVSSSPPSDVSQPFRVEFDAEQSPEGRSSEKEWALSVPLPSVSLPDPRKGVGADEKAVDFYIDEFVGRADIELPEGSTGRAPLSVTIARPFARFTSEYTLSGSMLTIERRLAILKPSVTGSESSSYESFKQAFDKDREQDFSIDPKRDASTSGAPAEALHAEGLSAFGKKDFKTAVELLEKSVAADPKVKDGYNDLGRALRSGARPQDALAAFARQIEADPFHESAYAERAYTLLDLGRREEAEKDLLKQIEVAPFKAWSYGKLGDIRMAQLQFDEAARYFQRAGALEPKKAETWQKLGWMQVMGGHASEALPALQRARGLNPDHETSMMIATALDLAGDTRGAGEMADAALPRLTELAAKLAPDTFGEKDLFYNQILIEFWRLAGTNALASDDFPKAERYLTAAWHSGLRADAAWQLGLLREKQKRPREAATLWSAAAVAGDWWKKPADVDKRLAAVFPPDPYGPPGRPTTYLNPGRDVVMRLRSVALSITPTDEFTEEVLLLIAPGGTVEGVRNLSGRNKSAFARVLAHLKAAKVPFAWPDERPARLVRRGLLTCNPVSTCSLVLDLGGMGRILGR